MKTLSPFPSSVIARSNDRRTSKRAGSSPDGLMSRAYAQALGQHGESRPDPGSLALYIHLPFCPSRCLSCDHDTTVSHDSSDIDRYLDSIETELSLVSGHLGPAAVLHQLHLGGGTPNYLSDPQLVRLVAMVERYFRLREDTEISLEAHPGRTSRTQLELLRGLGFGNIHFEIRDLHPEVQQAVGRILSLPMLRDAFDTVREVGFSTLSMDLVYGMPCQTPDSIRATLDQISRLGPDRVACYPYSLRPEIFQHQRALDKTSLPSLADRMAMFAAISNHLASEGYAWVGLDCFVREGDPLDVAQREGRLHRNGIGYTEHSSDAMIGCGTGAMSELANHTTRNIRGIADWRDSLAEGMLPVGTSAAFSDSERDRRRALRDLMCNLRLSDYAALMGPDGETDVIDRMHREGLVAVEDNVVQITPQGRVALHGAWGDACPEQRWVG
jgi:oxygen-independent coproporphyrinogen-3 oxidase